MEDDRSPGIGGQIDWAQYDDLSYESFRERAGDPSLTDSEKIGFPDALREGAEDRILGTIADLLRLDAPPGRSVMDIGCGCGELTRRLIALCDARGHELILVDSPEMLAQLPEPHAGRKVAGRFPESAADFGEFAGQIDAVVVYSVLHYVFDAQNIFDFVDAALELLAPGGRLLLGDIPNVSKRKRFFASERGVSFHREFMGTHDGPVVEFNRIERGKIDDSVVLALLGRARAQGFDAYVQPQPDDLPLANRREDILIQRP